MFVVALTQFNDVGARLAGLLSVDELMRADRFVMHKHRRRFVTARAILRLLCSAYSGIPAREIAFRYGPQGKPSIDGSIEFNMSDSSDRAVFAFADNRALGVDVEHLRPMERAVGLAERFFSSDEVEALRSVPQMLRDETFFNCWTRKEAYVKARGEGLTVPLHDFAVSILPDQEPRLLHALGNPAEVDRWSFHSIAIPDCVACLVVEGTTDEIRVRELIEVTKL